MRTLFTAMAMTALLVLSGSAAGETPLYEHPLFNPATQSYFELVPVKDADKVHSARNAKEINWEVASRLSLQRSYKGVHGRLAVVDRPETHLFLRTHFGARKHTWLGLRYWCDYRVLQWSTGEVHPHSGFAAWDSQWDQAGKCPSGEYLTVVYTPVSQGFKWIAKGLHKEYSAYFVEYPTGAE